MRFIRLLLICLTLVIALVAILVVVAFTPVMQTWFLERTLSKTPGTHASAESVLTRLSEIEVTNLKWEGDGIVLTVPTVAAGLSLKTTLWDRKLLFGSLQAKGWTLDLSHLPAPQEPLSSTAVGTATPAAAASVPSTALSAQQIARVFSGLLGRWKLPYETSLDGVDLEGDVLVASSSQKEPVKWHVLIKGGGMAAGRPGAFAFDATGRVTAPRISTMVVGVHGRLSMTMDSPRTVSGAEFRGKVSSDRGLWPEDLDVMAGVTKGSGIGEESYTLDLSRGARHLVAGVTHFFEATHRLVGTWKLDLRESDLTQFYPDRRLPTIALAGEGNFDADLAFAQVHAAGHIDTVASRLSLIAAPLDSLGSITVKVGFDLTHSGQSVRIDRLETSIAGARPIAVVQAPQSFSVDERTGELKLANPTAEWLTGSLQGFPLAALGSMASGLSFSGGDAIGDFSVNASGGTVTLRSNAPLIATGVSLQRAGVTLGSGLDLSVSLLVNFTGHGWQVHASPLTMSCGGVRLATIEAEASPITDGGRRVKIAGTWRADLVALASQAALPLSRWIKGRSASGDFSAQVGTSSDVTGKFVVVGRDPTHSVAVNGRAFVDAYGGISFHAPVAIALGSDKSEVSIDGSWSHGKSGPRLDAEFTGVNVALDHLGLLFAAMPGEHGVASGPISTAVAGKPSDSASARDQHPFWGDWSGRVKFEFYRLRVGDEDVNEAAATFNIDHGAIRLEDGRGAWVPRTAPPPAEQWRRRAKEEAARSQVKVAGSITFDAAAAIPYRLNATATIDVLDAARLFAGAPSSHEQVIEGRFAVADTSTGNGINLADLVGHRQDEFRLTSDAGVVRLLKTTVAEAIPEIPSRVSDTLVGVGSVVGSLFGMRGGAIGSGKNPVSKNAEAVLNFTSQVAEIAYDKLSFTATRGSDGAFHLAQIAMTAADERLTGTGEIASVKNLPLRAQALNLDLRLAVHGQLAELLTAADLASPDKDELGYTVLREPIRLGGTLEKIDESQWRDLLVKAALQTPGHGKTTNGSQR